MNLIILQVDRCINAADKLFLMFAKTKKIFKCNLQHVFVVLLCLLPVSLLTSFKGVSKSYKIKTIVIDAGHGGHDTGCLGSSVKEKNIALSVALKLGKYIEENFPDVRVIYTRKTDVFVTLYERADIANRNHADLFICVHCNSGNKAAYGVETYVMGLHKTDENLAVSMRENSAILLEKDYKQKYDGYDPNSPESFIIFNLYQNAYMEKSLTFASKVQYQVNTFANRNDRGVKQAGFLVLYKTAMPSVLVETGFLTNPNEEKYLSSEKGQTNIATSIFKAFKEYKVDMEEGDKPDNTSDDNNSQNNADVKTTPEKKETATPKKDAVPDTKNDHASTEPVNKPNTKPETPVAKKDSTIMATSTHTKPAATKINSSVTASGTLAVKAHNDSVAIKTTKPKPIPDNPVENIQPINNNLFYTVQIGATPKLSNAEMKKYAAIDSIKIITADDGMKRITVGNYSTMQEANKCLAQTRKLGYPDAFVTPYYNGKRISIAEAKKIK